MTIPAILDRTINANTSTPAIGFTDSDIDSDVNTLSVSGSSSNTSLVPIDNIVFGGTGANRTVTISPAANQIGAATIMITVSDGQLAASDSFVLTVREAVT